MKGDQENVREPQLLKGVQTFCKADGLGAVESLCAAVKGKVTSEGWSFRGTCVEPGRDRVASELQKVCLAARQSGVGDSKPGAQERAEKLVQQAMQEVRWYLSPEWGLWGRQGPHHGADISGFPVLPVGAPTWTPCLVWG